MVAEARRLSRKSDEARTLSQSRSRFDFYKQVYQFSFAKPKIVFRKNHDYRESIEKHGERMQQDVDLQR